MYQNPAHQAGTTSNPHIRPPGMAAPDPNFQPQLSESELREYFDQFCKQPSLLMLGRAPMGMPPLRPVEWQIADQTPALPFRHSLNPATPTSTLSTQHPHPPSTDEDVYCELVKFGNLLEMHVCDNVGDHLIGNVYARFDWEDEAQAAVEALNQRWYANRPLVAELSPVTDFREACCRQNDMGECNRGGFCNFMHLRRPSKGLLVELQQQQRVERKMFPSEKDKEREKEAAMFGEMSGGAGGGAGGTGGGYGGGRDRSRSPPPRRY